MTAQLKASNNNPRIVLGRANFLWNKGAYEAAAALTDSLAKLDPSIDMQVTSLSMNIVTDATRGRLKEAQRLTSQRVGLLLKRGITTAPLGASIDSAMVQIWFLGDKEKALSLIDAGLKRTPIATLPPLQRPYNAIGQIYALAGRPDRTREMLADFDKISSTMTAQNAASMRHTINATIALGEKRYLDAAHEARSASSGSCASCDEPFLGMMYDMAQMPDSAIAAFTKYVDSKSLQRINNDQYFLAMAYRRLGDLWENKGDKAKAVDYYTKFVDLWKNADPELQPKVAEAKSRLAKLTGLEGKK
jgi:tetratricopeptide (TPR) repeat protein